MAGRSFERHSGGRYVAGHPTDENREKSLKHSAITSATTFAALLAAGGVAIGVAWGGLLANFAAGAFLVFLRPFKVGVDHRVAILLLKERLARIPNVLATPAPDVEILQFTPAGPLLCVRPSCSNQDYWQVYFDTNRVIRESFGEAGFPTPVPGYAVTGLSVSRPLDTVASS